jgi:hypothetical protein
MGTVVLLPRRESERLVFERVLRPRARSFWSFAQNIALGTALRNRTNGQPADFAGVGLIDFEALVARLRDIDAARLNTASRQAYLAAAEADLDLYLRPPAENWLELDSSLTETVRAAFSLAAR